MMMYNPVNVFARILLRFFALIAIFNTCIFLTFIPEWSDLRPTFIVLGYSEFDYMLNFTMSFMVHILSYY